MIYQKLMDFRAVKPDIRQVLLFKPLTNDDKFLISLFSWQKVFTHSSDGTANLCGGTVTAGAICPQVQHTWSISPALHLNPCLLPPGSSSLARPPAGRNKSKNRTREWTSAPRPSSLPLVALHHLYNPHPIPQSFPKSTIRISSV